MDTLGDIMASGLDRARTGEASTPCAAVREGDLAALGRIYDEHHAAVRAFARRLLGEDAAEDLVHDTFLTLPKALGRFDGQGSLRSFIIGIAVNHARHYVRAAARRRAAIARFAQEPPSPDGQSVEDVSEQRRLAAMLVRALDTLPFDQRTTFVLAEVEERSSPEVAQILGIPEATVRTRLFHARRKLRAVLEREVAK